MIRITTQTAAALSALLLAACGGSDPAPAAPDGEASADVSDDMQVSSPFAGESAGGADPEREDDCAQAILAELGEPYASADLDRGRRLFRQCTSCHTLSEGARNLIGPNLHGMFGRVAGSVENFGYSDALETADFAWTAEELDQWLANPNSYLPGNRMSFAGYRQEDDRRDVIAYLAVATHAE